MGYDILSIFEICWSQLKIFLIVAGIFGMKQSS